MPTAHSQMAQLVLRLACKHDIVYQDENVTGNPPALQILLLLEQVRHQGHVPLAEEKTRVIPELELHLQSGVTRRASNEAHHQIKRRV